MMHPHTEIRFISEAIGFGVVATKLIPKGTITWILDPLDQIFSPSEVAQMTIPYREIIDKYSFRDHKGNHVLCWDHSRYVNHSFRSNCLTTAYNFEIAIRDIHPGEELTDDYGYLNVSEPFEAFPEPGVKRKKVMPDDLLRYHRSWDQKLRGAFKHLPNVAQPLSAYMDAPLFKQSLEIGMGLRPMDSILNCYCNGVSVR